MRFLATQHVYKELRPDVFTNTRLSSVLDTGKSVEHILKKYVVSAVHPNVEGTSLTMTSSPSAKHDDTSGFPALVAHQ